MRFLQYFVVLYAFFLVAEGKERTISGAGFNFSKLLSSRPTGAPQAFDCKARILAYQYAKKIQPWKGDLRSVFDALELSTLCGQVLQQEEEKKMFFEPPKAATSFYVDAVKGSDSNSGSLNNPFRSIQRAVQATRQAPKPGAILLRQGTFYLNETIHLGTEDSHLSVMNYNGEKVYISGGIPLNTTWKPYNVSKEPKVVTIKNSNNVYGRAVSMGNTDTIKFLGLFNTTDQCRTACLAYNSGGQTCKSFTFHTPSLKSEYARQCFGETDDTWGPTPENDIDSGRIVQMNVYVADIRGHNIGSMLGLQQLNGGKRVIRARYPNADTETAVFPEGWVLFTQKWLPPKNYSKAVTIKVSEPYRTDITMFQYYSIGIGGSCSIFDPPESYWCSEYNEGGGSGLFETPSGLVYNANTFLTPWKNPKDAVIHVWHPFHWAMWMYDIKAHDPSSRTITWDHGGFQGARGAISDNGNAGEWYVDNVFEELDSPNEYYYDSTTKLLYYFYNGTGAPPSSHRLVASNLKTLFDVRGTMSEPVKDISFRGLHFVNTAYTYMDPHGVPSGGDWAMQRSGALFFEGCERTTIEGNIFERLDGNALVLSGYHRNATISKNEFLWIGDSAMVSWGYSLGMDGTNGEQPRFTKVVGNLVHELGLFEKQSSPWFQAITSQTLLQHNIFFNGPRALINFNDGFGGANEMVNNLLFNPNRDSSDQGPFNSWDRMPFLTDVRDGTPSLTPAFNDIHHNFFICNYGSNMCIDNDDGSSYYLNHHNFEVYGGHKSDFGGHNKFTYSTIMAYSQDYQQGLCGEFPNAVPNFVDGYFNNSCIQGSNAVPYLIFDDCDPKKIDPTVLPIDRKSVV